MATSVSWSAAAAIASPAWSCAAAPENRLGIHQVGIRQTEHREVNVHEVSTGIRSLVAVHIHVSELLNGVPIGKGERIFDLQVLIFREEILSRIP